MTEPAGKPEHAPEPEGEPCPECGGVAQHWGNCSRFAAPAGEEWEEESIPLMMRPMCRTCTLNDKCTQGDRIKCEGDGWTPAASAGGEGGGAYLYSEIEHLLRENERLRKALEQIESATDGVVHETAERLNKIARAALAGGGKDGA